MWHTINVIFFPLIRNFTLSTSHFHFFPSHSEHRLSSLHLSLCLTSLKPCLAQPSHRQHPSRSHSNILRPPLVRVQVLLSSSPLVRVQVLVSLSLSLSVFSSPSFSLCFLQPHQSQNHTNQTHKSNTPKSVPPSFKTHTHTNKIHKTQSNHNHRKPPLQTKSTKPTHPQCRSTCLLQIGEFALDRF